MNWLYYYHVNYNNNASECFACARTVESALCKITHLSFRQSSVIDEDNDCAAGRRDYVPVAIVINT